MTKPAKNLDRLVENLDERVKELSCLYEVEELLHQADISQGEIFHRLIDILPPVWKYPEACKVKIVYRDAQYLSKGFKETEWMLNSQILLQDQVVGYVRVCYIEEKPESETGPFLQDEQLLLDTVAKRISDHILYQTLKKIFDRWEDTRQTMSEKKSGEWKVVLELIRRTDQDLFIRLSRKMLNHLTRKGVEEAEKLLRQFSPNAGYDSAEVSGETNIPLEKRGLSKSFVLSDKVFKLATHSLTNTELLSLLQRWMQQDKTAFLVRAVSTKNTSINEISDAIRRYYQLTPDGMQLVPSSRLGVRAALIRRIFSDQLEFITIAKNYIRVTDFRDLLPKIIFPKDSHGKLGGKSAGVILAHRILMNSRQNRELLQEIEIPKSWFLSSDVMITFMNYNNMEEILEQKYKDIEDVRKEYPNVVQLFKNSYFPPDIIQGLSMILDDFDDKPVVVRSSSLLEDRLGSAFAGKYKSLFLANQGGKRARLNALMDAIAEIYASTLGPDPIGYRAERGLLDFHEEMGIIIQEVVGKKVGEYFFPAFAGVAFSNNEFRWSPRINKEDGLVRMVPGLGTRAVDRVSDDFPVLIAPGQPGLRASVSLEEMIRYSPQKIDVINLKNNCFETLKLDDLMRRYGDDYPAVEKLVSIFDHNHLRKPSFNTDFTQEDLIFNFDALINNTKYVEQMRAILAELQSAMHGPVDIEFASDGKKFYLLQCRPQSYSKNTAPAKIPKFIPKERYIFSAERFISNGSVTNIRYLVYVSPEAYSDVESIEKLHGVGRVVGRLNQVLPKQQFILMGPGRWGSRGDIKLGVNITYADINNTAMLIEIARRKGNYTPDLSFGTHFFQDLVEANIRYLPLYPDDEGIIFNESFLLKSKNLLAELVPEYKEFSDIIYITDTEKIASGMMLQVLMNADEDKAVAILTPPVTPNAGAEYIDDHLDASEQDQWRWRTQMAEKMAQQFSKKRFGVKGLYLIGSTQDLSAQSGSDIDLLVRFAGDKEQKADLLSWFEGWSLCLDELNYSRTGHKAGGLLDIKLVEDARFEELGSIQKVVQSLFFSGYRELMTADME